MSDIKMNGGAQPAKLTVAAASPPKSQKDNANDAVSGQAGVQAQNAAQEKAAEAVAKQVEAGQEQVENAVTQLNDYVQSVQRNLQFNLDDSSGKTIITVVDIETSEVVRQIPDDVALKLAQDLHQDEPLSLFNAKV